MRRLRLKNISVEGSANNQLIVSNTSVASWQTVEVSIPKISSVTITDSSYNNLDDTAISSSGGFIKITGSGFTSGSVVYVDETVATSTTFVSSTEIRAQLPAKSTGVYHLYIVASDGSFAIRANGITYSDSPTWVTSNTQSFQSGASIELQLNATSDSAVTYAVQEGSNLPAGLTLASNGYLTGSVTVGTDTLYSFTVEATDLENQNSPRAFNVTITAGDDYFKFVTALFKGNGSNNANNNTFIDSSTNNLTVTRYGNPSQGTFSPYGERWSTFFDGSGDALTVSSAGSALSLSGNFTIEFWTYRTAKQNAYEQFINAGSNVNSFKRGDGYGWYFYSGSASYQFTGSTEAVPINSWTHVAFVRSGSTITMFVNGTSVGSNTYSSTIDYSSTLNVNLTSGEQFAGFISNLRIMKGTALYSSTFTPSTTPLTAIANTSLLICNSSRFKDTSSNAFTVTPSGDVSVRRFSPFSPGGSYNANTIGGSGYFDGSGDYLDSSANNALILDGAFTVECWYLQKSLASYPTVFELGQYTNGILFRPRGADGGTLWVNGSGLHPSSATVASTAPLNTWNHAIVCRNAGNSLSLFINGTRLYNGTVSGTLNTTGALVRIASSTHTGGQHHHGYVSDFRIVKGSTVYDPTQSTVTIPSAPLTAIANTSYHVKFTNAGIVDSSMQEDWECIGGVRVDTTTKKYGSGSLYFDSSDDRLVSASNPGYAFGTGDFTIEFWMNSNDVSSSTQKGMFQTSTTAGGLSTSYATGVLITQGFNSSGGALNGGVGAILGTGSSYIVIGNSSPSVVTGSWYHVALTRAANTARLFVNGTLVGSASHSSSLDGQNLCIGGYYSTGYLYNGYLDDFRITKGYARYTSNFTPPTELVAQ